MSCSGTTRFNNDCQRQRLRVGVLIECEVLRYAIVGEKEVVSLSSKTTSPPWSSRGQVPAPKWSALSGWAGLDRFVARLRPQRQGRAKGITNRQDLITKSSIVKTVCSDRPCSMVGIEFFGPPFSEAQLLQITYGFEQATHAPKPPQSTPPRGASCTATLSITTTFA